MSRSLRVIIYGLPLAIIVVGLLLLREPSTLRGLYDYRRELPYRQQLEEAAELLAQYHARNGRALEALANNSPIASLIDPALILNDVGQVEEQFEALLNSSRDYIFLRLLDRAGDQLYFSSYPEDIMDHRTEATRFVALSQLSAESPSPSELMSAQLDKPLYSPTHNSFVYRWPIVAENNQVALLALYVAPHSLTLELRNQQIIGEDDQLHIGLRGLLLNANPSRTAALSQDLDAPLLDGQTLNIEEQRLVLLKRHNGADTIVMLVAESQFRLTSTEIFSYGTVVVTSLFLLLFFLLNIHPSPQAIIKGRMHRQRKQLMTILEKQPQLRDSQLLRHLASERDQIYAQVTHGIAPRRASSASLKYVFKQAWMELLAHLYRYGFLSAPQELQQNDRETRGEVADLATSPSPSPIPSPAAQVPLESASLSEGGPIARLGLLRRAIQFRRAAHPKVVEKVQGLYQISQKMYNEIQQESKNSPDNSDGQLRQLLKNM